MAVQFKFRSSVKFDSVDLEGRAFISVRDLKAKITRHNNLNISQDSDLVFSDAVTGQEYSNEDIQIPCGSSVIIKRVPAGSVHLNMPHFNRKDSANMPNVETIDFDDFGVDVYPVPEATLFRSGLDTCSPSYEPNTGVASCMDPAVGGCHKLEASGISDAIPRSHSPGGVEQIIPQTKSKPEVQGDFMEKMDHDPVDTKHADLPGEMKCSLCNSFFKEAVMIPCCQHSFCGKCIRQVLLEKGRCPKCFSTKCRIEDLLPNISLRQAIEHYQESQNLVTVPNNAFCQYAPDEESGIQAKDVSCGGSIFQRESEMPHSPETGIGSSNFLAESACQSPFKNHIGARNMQTSSLSLHRNNQINGKRYGSTPVAPYGFVAFDDFQGEGNPLPEEAEPVMKKKRPPWVYAAGGEKSFSDRRNRKGDHACYMCGSPDHLIRECPVATSQRPMLHAGHAIHLGAMQGYVPPYWDGALLPHSPPFGHVYGMTAFNASLIPCAPFSIHPYMHMPSMYRSVPGFGGYMGVGGVAPLPETGKDCYINRSEFLGLEGQGKRRKISEENVRRVQCCVDEDRGHQYNGTGRLQDHKSVVNREMSVSYSSDGSTKRFRRQDRHRNWIDDENTYSLDGHQKSSHVVGGHREKSSSEIDDLPSSSSWHSEEKHKHHYRSSREKNEKREHCDNDKYRNYHRSSRYQPERREQCGSDSSRSHSEKDDKRKRIQHDRKRQKHYSNSGSSLEHSGSSDKKPRKGSNHNIRKSEHNAKSTVVEQSHDRWRMVSGSDEDCAEDYRYCKRKRVK